MSAVRLVNFPRDGHAPGVCATGSDVFPPRSSGTARSGIDEAMGPWLCFAHYQAEPTPDVLLRDQAAPMFSL